MGGRDRMGRMGDMGGPEKTDSDDWRARPTADADDGPPKREESAFGSRDRYGDRDGPRRENDRGFGGDRDRGFGGDRDSGRDRGRDRYDDRGGESGGETTAQNLTYPFGSRRDRDDGGRRAFGSGYRRDDDYQSGGGGGSRYGDRDRYGGDREDRYERQDEGSEERREGGPTERPKLVLKPRSMPKEVEQAGGGGAPPAAPAAARSSGRASIFGGAKPVDTAAKEREVEEKLQRQLEEDKSRGFERKPRDRDRDPSWRNEEPPSERSRTGSESSQPGSTSGGRASHLHPTASRRRESERSVENEVFSGKEDDPPSLGACPSSANSSTFSSKEPLKVMPAPPPKENAWAKRPAVSAGSSEGRSPISPSDAAPHKLSSSSANERGSGKDENKVDGVRLDRGPPRGRGGAAGPGAGRGRGEGANRNRRREEDRKDKRRSRDSRPAPEPKKYEESPTLNFSSASKYAALLMDGEQGDDAENGVE
ncbi:unnamed protein product [Coregonus sp. 'balchen']|nr:unnamed protein product [Coregonus sp. 'balchen']